MKIFMTGATGFVGSHVLTELLRNKHQVGCLIRKPHIRLEGLPVEMILGDISKPDTFIHRLASFDAIIHLVAIIKEQPRHGITFNKINLKATETLLKSAKDQDVKRFIHLSALGADLTGETEYFRTKGAAEKAVLESGLDYTIFRPSFIFGPDDEVYTMLADIIKTSPFGIMPVFGDGQYRHQPVSVINVAQAIVKALHEQNTIKKTYNLGGPDVLSYKQQLLTIGNVVGKRCRPFLIPLALSKLLVKVAQQFPFSPIDSDRLTMLVKDNICDNSSIVQDLDLELITFEKGIIYLTKPEVL